MTTIVVDIFESDDIVLLLESYQVTVVRQNMVPMGLADFYWIGDGGIKYTFEHKTARQLASEMGGRLDGQLRKHSQHADIVGIIVDGVMTPRDGGGIDFWRLAKNAKVYHQYGKTPMGFEALQAYLWSLNRDGIYTFHFDDLNGMALGLASFAANSLKTRHNALTHHIRSKPVTWKEDPYTMTLMGMHKARIGERTAEKILEHWDTPWDFYQAEPDEAIKVIGPETYKRAMSAIGKEIT
jgi:hypothetical protein